LNLQYSTSKRFQPIADYLEKSQKSIPHHIFIPKLALEYGENKTRLERASQINLQTLPVQTIQKREKQNLANNITRAALTIAKDNKSRHQAVQDFFLINDSTTIAAEIPVYLTQHDLLYFFKKGFLINPKAYQTPITGHIDILQLRNNLLHILDYKPDAKSQKPKKQE